MPQHLKKILDKNPIIPTATASDIKRYPDRIEALYMETVMTHMSIGETGQYQKRILDCLLRNSKTFNGAVVGEYGFGKTSMLIYLWAFSLENKIMAVPPYQWDNIGDHISVIHHWVSYKLKRHDARLIKDITSIYDKYKQPSIENEAKSWAEQHAVDINTANQIIASMVDSGRISLDIKADDIIDYCDELTSYLQDNTEYKGLLVITDELQQSITQLNQRIVYDFLFDMTNNLVDRKGNFGFLWGFPVQTQADLQRSRSDILDRLNSNNFFLRLSNIYDSTFASVLWDKFCDYLEIQNLKYSIVDKSVLISIGQICDGDRRDLGNGPRSVISAFNRIAGCYLKENKTYKTLDFINDCLDDQVVLGTRSEFKNRLNSILNTPGFSDEEKDTLKILAAYPNGIPDYIINESNYGNKISELIQKTGGLGRVIVKDINSYLLKVMRKSASSSALDSIVEDEVRKYFSQFSPDKEHEDRGLKVFNDILETDIFNNDNGDRFETWKLKEKNIDHYSKNHIFKFEGSFDDKYPLRKVRVITRVKGSSPFENNPNIDPDKEDMSFTFSFTKEKVIDKRVIRLNEQNNFLMQLSFNQQIENINDHKINDIVPDEKQSPIFFLGLIDHLNNAVIPNDEVKMKEHLVSVLKQNIMFNLFNEDLLGDIENSTIELNNQGDLLVKDLFKSICDITYPEYVTLMSGANWKGKITGYINVLKIRNDNIGLMELRGNSPVLLSQDRAENKSKIARLFNVGNANFESHLSDLKSFAKFKNNEFYFIMHPLETYIQEHLENNGNKVIKDQKDCISADFSKSIVDLIKLKGYTDEEINIIVEIMEARQLLLSDKQSKTIYKVLENRDQLKIAVSEYYDRVINYYNKLNSIRDGLPVSKIDFDEIKKKIDCVETNDQAGLIRTGLKNILNQLINYSVSGIKSSQISLRQLKEQLHEESVSLKSITDNDMKDFPTTTLTWQNELFRRRIELTNELNSLSTLAKNNSDKSNSLIQSEINEDEAAINTFLTINDKYNNLISDAEALKSKIVSAKDNAKNLVKWKSILKLCDSLNEKLILYSRYFDSDDYRIKFDEFNCKVNEGLQSNPNITLQNHENYKTDISIVQSDVINFINNLKTEWDIKAEYCRSQVKKITGIEPNWRLRWSDVPYEAYTDLNESLQAELKKYVKRIEVQFTQMEDDVLYTKEVLNHEKAINNKKIQERIKKTIDDAAIICTKLDDTDLFKTDVLDPITDELIRINFEFAELNKMHSAIIKPTTIEMESEKSFVELLNKNEGLDLKSLIIAYQKECNPNINLTDSRDEVLDIIKSLFLKKQVTIQVRRGKV